MHPINMLKEVKEIEGNNAKRDYITENRNNDDFVFLLKTLLDPFEVLNVKTIELPSKTPRYWSANQDRLKNLVDYLKATNRSNASLLEIDKYLQSINPEEAVIVADILTKTYKLGIGGKLANKGLGYPLISDFTLMKAEPSKEDLIPWENGLLYVQEKLDGVRCVIKVEAGKCTALTFKGKALQLPSIFKAVEKFCFSNGLDNIILDGELMHQDNRTSASGAVNRILKGSKDADDSKLQLVVFYYMTISEFNTKTAILTEKGVVSNMSALRAVWQNKHMTFTETYLVRNMDEVDKLFKEVRDKGGEGLILKRVSGKYEWKRSRNWIKLKSSYSTTLEVVGTYPGGAGTKYEGIIGGLICSTKDGIMFNVGSGLSDDDRMSEDFVGRFIEVAFTDVGYSDEGDLYLDFPRYKGDRSFEKSEADTLKQAVGEIPRYLKGK